MNVTNVKTGAFANGFDKFCVNCGRFFSAQIMDDGGGDAVAFCPHCGEDILLSTIDSLLNYCAERYADPANFFTAFPFDEPIPQSRTGATPRQVAIIIASVIDRKEEKLPVTVENTAAILDYPAAVVAAVFDEMHITETEKE